jgi:glycosyltransferase involved in cell wall biosynthesis
MLCRIGYLVPEFPGQTHTFFWREVKALETKGIEVDFVSTRRPTIGLISHAWADVALKRTVYLAPLGLRGVTAVIGQILFAGPFAWYRCARAITRARDDSFAGKVRLLALLLVGAKLACLARRRGWRHVHVHSCGDSANAALFAHLLLGTRYSLTLHSPLPFFGPNQAQKWRYADFVFCVARALYQEAAGILGADFPAAVEIVPMGVDIEGFVRRTEYVAWDGRNVCRIFSCGRLNPGKGFADLIQAIATLKRAGIPVLLRIAGGDDSGGEHHRCDLERLIADLALGEQVEILGSVSEAVVKEELQAAHVFALASHEEALGVATMEAMAMSVPVVVTRVGGVPELVSDGVEGLLVPPRDSGALATALERVLRDGSLAQRMGRAGRGKVERAFHSGLSVEHLASHVLRP